jgi:site-specific DNA-cytosine methylase
LTDIDCAALGLPQRRKRILIVGGIGRRGERFVNAVKSLSAIKKTPPTLVKDVLLPVPELESLPNHGPVSPHPSWYDEVTRQSAQARSSVTHAWEAPRSTRGGFQRYLAESPAVRKSFSQALRVLGGPRRIGHINTSEMAALSAYWIWPLP